MRTLNKMFLSDPLASPFGRRRRGLLRAAVGGKGTASKKEAAIARADSIAKEPQPMPMAVPMAKATPKPAAKTILNSNSGTIAACDERLHLVLARRSKAEQQELHSLMSAHAGVKTVCVYTDSPLLSQTVSPRQQRLLLTQVAHICTQMQTLQLDFSSEFGPQAAVALDCELLASILDNAPRLESLLMKDVPLSGDVLVLKRALLEHPRLRQIELKWCTQAEAQSESDAHTQAPILSTLIHTFTEMEHLKELTLLLSRAHNLPIPALVSAHSKIQKLTFGLEQRHAHVTQLTIEQRHIEQTLLMETLKDLAQNTTLTECNLHSHHWKSNLTLQLVHNILSAPNSNLTVLSLTDYNYGSDDPKQLLQVATAIQSNTKLQRFTLFSKKRLHSTVDKPTRRKNATAIEAALVKALQQNTTLQKLDIVHAGIQITDTSKLNSSSKTPAAGSAKHWIAFYLMTNRYQARQRFVLNDNISIAAWGRFILQHKENTPLIHYLLQENPNLLLLATVANSGTGKSPSFEELMWEYHC